MDASACRTPREASRQAQRRGGGKSLSLEQENIMDKSNSIRLMSCAFAFLCAIFCSTQVMGAWQGGLKGGKVTGGRNLTEFPAITNLYSSPHVAATQNKPPWEDNITWVYWGQMYFNGGTYHFAENIDDAAYLEVNGVVYIDNGAHNVPTKDLSVNNRHFVEDNHGRSQIQQPAI